MTDKYLDGFGGLLTVSSAEKSSGPIVLCFYLKQVLNDALVGTYRV